MSATCHFCGGDVDPQSRRTWKRLAGWHRAGAKGGSDVALRETIPDVFACDLCIRRLQAGHAPLQTSLLDEIGR
jgi:hypothetical protein